MRIGIGYETAKEFAKRGARVILACRNKEKAEEAQRNIIKESDNTNVIVKIVDFSSLNSIRALADDINVTEERLDILVNNAGATNLGKDLTEDGLNSTMQVNYFGSFLLTILLIGELVLFAKNYATFNVCCRSYKKVITQSYCQCIVNNGENC